MKVLGQQVITTTRSGNFQYATVESIANNLATVRLSTGGVRLTNLQVYGTLPEVGATVIIDYTTGTPYIRSSQPQTVADTALELAQTPTELPAATSYTYPVLSAGLPLGSVSGIVTDYVAGQNIAFGQPVALSSNGYIYPAIAKLLEGVEKKDKVIGICAEPISGGSAGTILLHGFINYDGWTYPFTTGGYIFLGDYIITPYSPTEHGESSVIVGVAFSSTLMYINPSLSIAVLI